MYPSQKGSTQGKTGGMRRRFNVCLDYDAYVRESYHPGYMVTPKYQRLQEVQKRFVPFINTTAISP